MKIRSDRPSRARALGAFAACVAVPRAVRAQTAPIRIGMPPVEATAEAFYAQDTGLFAKAGVAVEIVVLRSGPAVAAAVAGGDLQIGASNVLSLANSKARNLPFTLIAPGALYTPTNQTEQVVVLANGPIRSAKDLDGKIVGGQSIGSTAHLAILAWIDQNGGDASTVKYVEVPPASVVEALEAGRIFASAIQDPELSNAGTRVRRLGRAYDAIAKVYMLTAWFAENGWLAKNGPAARKAADALVAAGQWAAANRTAAAAIFEKYTKIHLDRSGEEYAQTLDPALLQPVFDSGIKYKIVTAPVSAASFIWTGK